MLRDLNVLGEPGSEVLPLLSERRLVCLLVIRVEPLATVDGVISVSLLVDFERDVASDSDSDADSDSDSEPSSRRSSSLSYCLDP